MNKIITIEECVASDIQTVWHLWNTPSDIEKWMHASDDWECRNAVNNLKEGGGYCFTLAAKNGEKIFDVTGKYTEIAEPTYIASTMNDGRTVTVSFTVGTDGIDIVQTFEMENENSEELQRHGWQNILTNFKKYVETLTT